MKRPSRLVHKTANAVLVRLWNVVALQLFGPAGQLDRSFQVEQAPAVQKDPDISAVAKTIVTREEMEKFGDQSVNDALRRAAGDTREPVIVINADARANYQSVVDIMQAAQTAGYPRISFATQSPH